MSPILNRSFASLATLVVLVGAFIGVATDHLAPVAASAGATASVVVGWIVLRHDARSAVGPALAWSGACIVLVMINDVLAESAYTDDPLPLAGVARHLWVGSWPINLAGAFTVLLTFPRGRRSGWPWRALPATYALGTLGVIYAEWGSRQIDGAIVSHLTAPQVVVETVAMILITGSLLFVIASPVVVFRRGDEQVREQVRWLALAGVLSVGLLLTGWIIEAVGAPLTVAYAPFLTAIVVLMPLTIGIAILKHDLFDVDRLLSETATWLLTLLVSALIFGGVVMAVAEVVRDYSTLGATAAAFVTALALLPIHRWMVEFVGRFVDRDRYVALAEIERFTAEVGAGTRAPEEVENALRQALGDDDLRVALHRPDGSSVSLTGEPISVGDGVTLSVAGTAVATLALGTNSARARRRASKLAEAAWVPIEVARLRSDLQVALGEARASRVRVAEASAKERRRIERDLHDGAQQRLVATGMRLRLLQRGLRGSQAQEVDDAVTELQATIEELRGLANDLRPSRLDDGLEAALAEVRDACPLPLELQVSAVTELDDARSLVAYFVVNEAVTNALKHAAASRIQVSIRADGEGLAIEVADDGVGGLNAEVPLTALRDRLSSVNGSLRVISPPGQGTTIKARF